MKNISFCKTELYAEVARLRQNAQLAASRGEMDRMRDYQASCHKVRRMLRNVK